MCVCGEGAPITSPKEGSHREKGVGKRLHERTKGKKIGPGWEEDRALMSRFHKPPGVKTETQTRTLPNSRAVWKRKKKHNKKIHILIQKSYMMCRGTKVFFTAFFICDLTRPTTGTPSAVGV